jgi:hypothetical protein
MPVIKKECIMGKKLPAIASAFLISTSNIAVADDPTPLLALPEMQSSSFR